MKDKVEKYRAELIETAVEQDDDVMEKYLEGDEPDIATIKKCIRKGTIDLAFFPTYCGSSFKNKGVQHVLDAVVDYLPSPTEVEPQPEVDLEGNETGKFAIVDPDRPAPRAGVQDHGRPVRRAHLHPHLLGHASRRATPFSTPSPARPSASAAWWKCTPTTATKSTPPRPATSSPSSA